MSSRKYSKKDISVVIPNWNGQILLARHLPRVLEACKGVKEIIVADDKSSDASIECLKKNFPQIIAVKKDRHEGYASTVNAGVRIAKGDIVVLLNTDVEPENGFLDGLLGDFTDPGVFAVGCMDKSLEHQTVILRGRGESAWIRGFYVHRRGDVDKRDTAWVSGGSGAFRKTIWERLGGMNTLYDPFYWEDVDLSYRALKAGYKLIFEPKSVVNHFHEMGTIAENYDPSYVRKIAYRNQYTFVWKNISDYRMLLEHIVWSKILVVREMVRGDFSMLHGYVSAWSRMYYILKARRKDSALWMKRDRDII